METYARTGWPALAWWWQDRSDEGWGEPSLLVAQQNQGREHRIFWLLLCVWVVNIFDLGFTLLAREQLVLTELNPLAAKLLRYGPAAVAAYKYALLILATGILWWNRRHLLSEICAWVCAAFCVGLSFWWHRIYLEVQPAWMEMHIVHKILPSH